MSKSNGRKIRLIHIIAALVLAVVAWTVYSDATEAAPVRLASISEGPIEQYVEERARTSLPRIHHITMPLPGRILPLEVEEGDRVDRGQLVARLEEDDWVDAATSAGELVVAMKNSLDASAAELKASEARAEYTAWVKEALDLARKADAVPEREAREAQWQHLEAVVKREESQATYHAMDALYVITKLMPPIVSRNFARTRILSPVGGVVLKRHVANEKTLLPGAPVLDIGDLETLQVTADILTGEAVRVQPGDRVEIFGEAIGAGSIDGTVRRIRPEAFTKLSSLGVEQQRVAVDIDFVPEDLAKLEAEGRTLGLNYRIRVRIVTDQRDQVLRIPRTALFRGREGGWETFRVDPDGRAARIPLEIGLMNDEEAEVRSGLSAGDRVIVAPESGLADGARVEAME